MIGLILGIIWFILLGLSINTYIRTQKGIEKKGFLNFNFPFVFIVYTDILIILFLISIL